MLRTIGVLLAVGLLAGCGSPSNGDGVARPLHPGPTPPLSSSDFSPTPPRKTSATYGCLTQDEALQGSYSLPTDSGSLDAYLRDPGPDPAKTVLVFSHQAGGDLCEWQPHWADFSKAGYGILAFNSGGGQGEIATVVRYLAQRGASRVVLVGASKGGTASLVAAVQPLALPVQAVVALSAPVVYHGDDAGKAVANLKIPGFFAAEMDDMPFRDNIHTLYMASPDGNKVLKLYNGSRHGALLLDDGGLRDVLDFLAKYAPLSPPSP
ncbi:dienelactone hydrolase family protein [Kitasatospora azatica]|uniref:alpha/beta hydrolase n=1 Tax=Kitasatospora azatica TaxID=58347 RepID=UPI00068A4430|nr:alpha/beta hydrolase [Kitasatospora azatica]